jgi:phasin family protein
LNNEDKKRNKKMNTAFKNMKMPGVDLNAMMGTYKKNLDTIHAASQVAADVMSSLSGLQNKFMQQTIGDMGSMMKQMLNEQNASKVSESAKEYTKSTQETWGKAASHGKEVADMMSKSGQKVSDLLRERVRDHMDEVAQWMDVYKKTKH